MTTIDGNATTDTAERLRTVADDLIDALHTLWRRGPADHGPLTSAEASPIRLGCVELLEALGAHQAATLPIDSVPAAEPEPNRHLRRAGSLFPGDVFKPSAHERWVTVVSRDPVHAAVDLVCEWPDGYRETLRFSKMARLHVSDKAADDGEPVAPPAGTGHASAEDVTRALGCEPLGGDAA